MIKYSQISTIFSGLSFEIEEYNYDNAENLSLPYCAYVCSSGDSVSADGITYIQLLNVRLVLVDDNLDFTSQTSIETIFKNNGVFFQKEYDFDEEQRIYTITYDFEVLA